MQNIQTDIGIARNSRPVDWSGLKGGGRRRNHQQLDDENNISLLSETKLRRIACRPFSLKEKNALSDIKTNRAAKTRQEETYL